MKSFFAFLLPVLYAACLCVAGIAGCSTSAVGSEEGQAVFATDRHQYQAADSLTLRLENNTRLEYGINLCTSSSKLEKRRGSAWKEVEGCVHFDQPDRQIGSDEEPEIDLCNICQLAMQQLRPGETARFRFRLNSGLASGTYRFRDSVMAWSREGKEMKAGIVTEPFEIVND